MIDGSEYHWRQIAACADGAIGLPLRHLPFLDEALRAVGCELPGDTPGDVLCAACAELMTRRMVLAGDDD